MNILFVTMVPFESNTSATIQNKGIIKGFVDLGHNVDVITIEPRVDSISYDDSMNDIYNNIRNQYFIKLNSNYAAVMQKKHNNQANNINVTTINLKTSIRNIVKKIYDSVAIYDAQQTNVKQVSKLEIQYEFYDFIVSASDPKSSHLIVSRILKNNPGIKAKWIQYWGDPMFNDITRKKDWRDSLVKYHENKLISKADKVIYASPLTLNIQKLTYPNHSCKMDYASQVYVSGTVKNNISKTINNSKIEVGYFGAYDSKIRNIKPLYDAALTSEYNLNICGPSDIKLKSTKNIKINGKVTYKIAVKMEEKSDILVTICNSTGTQIPGKIYYCAGYDKPIIVVLDGEYKLELRKYLESFNRYILCDNDPISIKKAIDNAVKKLNDNSFEISTQLTPKYMAKRILE